MDPLKNATLVFLVKRRSGVITEICLAMKKRGFGMNRWNGAGGKVEVGESTEEAAVRETREEVGVIVQEMYKVAELLFYFFGNAPWNQRVGVYLCEQWVGEPTESEEMNPRWFAVDKIPFTDMWPDDIFWLPEILKGKLVKANFTFSDNDVIKDQCVEIVERL